MLVRPAHCQCRSPGRAGRLLRLQYSQSVSSRAHRTVQNGTAVSVPQAVAHSNGVPHQAMTMSATQPAQPCSSSSSSSSSGSSSDEEGQCEVVPPDLAIQQVR